MGKIYSKRYSETDPSVARVVGTILPMATSQDFKAQLDELAHDLAPMHNQEKILDNLDVILGRPAEKIIPRELLVPAPKEWNFFPSAGADKIVEISESIKIYGLLHNITVWAKEDGKYMILGGHTRVACFDYLAENDVSNSDKWTNIPALVYGKEQLTEVDAKRIIIVSNIDQREMSISTKARAYKAIYQLEKEQAFYRGAGFNSRRAAAAQAGVTDNLFYRHMRLLELIPELQSEVDSDKLSIVVGFNISYLTEELQRYIYDKRLYTNISSQASYQIRNCKTLDELISRLTEINAATKYFKYTYQTRKQKSSKEEVLPVLVEKDSRNAVADLYIQAVLQSNLPEEIKQQLITYMNNAKK